MTVLAVYASPALPAQWNARGEGAACVVDGAGDDERGKRCAGDGEQGPAQYNR